MDFIFRIDFKLFELKFRTKCGNWKFSCLCVFFLGDKKVTTLLGNEFSAFCVEWRVQDVESNQKVVLNKKF